MRSSLPFLDGSYSDLACERRRADTSVMGVSYAREVTDVGVWERIKITTDEGAESIGRPKGIYNTLMTKKAGALDKSEIEPTTAALSSELLKVTEDMDLFPRVILVVGLGNSRLTPDAVGPMSADRVNATREIKRVDKSTFQSLDCAEIAVIKPGVSAESGLDAFDTVKGICDGLKPDLVIAIDALAAGAAERLGTTVQISSTGILPGSGLGAVCKAISYSTLSVPVIAIGVPTVMDSRIFTKEEKKESLPDEEVLFVSPKDINLIVDSASEMIGGAINKAFGIEI